MDKYWEIVRRNVIPTSTSQQLESLKNLLSHFCKSDISFKTAKVSNGSLNYVEVVRRVEPREQSTVLNSSTPTPDRHKRTLILMHGFGSGLGFFFNNYDDLSKSFDRVIAVDWLGMGGSSRQSSSSTVSAWCGSSHPAPRFSVIEQVYNSGMIESSQKLPSTKAAVDFFVDSLEEMRELLVAEGTLKPDDSLHLAGHSLGGYLAAQYALKYPKMIDSLILISPVGIPQQPARDTRTKSGQMSWGLYTASTAWAANFTPQSVVRMAGRSIDETCIQKDGKL
jgi:pimeloyl-ACP methyl ester carboxylesterase